MSTISEHEARTGETVEKTDRTRMISELVEDLGWVRNSTAKLHENVNRLQTEVFDQLLDHAVTNLTGRTIKSVLGHLSDLGFSWQDIASMAGVSVPGLRKWRQGEVPTVENRDRIFRLLAFMGLVTQKCMIDDPASWLEMPLRPNVPITGIDLLGGRRFDLAFEHARDQGSTSDSVLDRFDPDWRRHLQRRTEVFEASDGQLSIRAKKA